MDPKIQAAWDRDRKQLLPTGAGIEIDNLIATAWRVGYLSATIDQQVAFAGVDSDEDAE